MKLLITGAEGDIADAICRIARDAWPDAIVHGSDITGDDWPRLNGFAEIHTVPRATSQDYLKSLRLLHEREAFAAIVPVTDAELGILSAASVDDLPLVMVDRHYLSVCLDKSRTAEWLEEIGLSGPRTIELGDLSPADLPVIVKPRQGHGSAGLEIVRSADRIPGVIRERSGDAIAQQYVGDASREFTSCVYRHRASGEMRTVILRRILQGGLTGRATVETSAAIEEVLSRIALAGDLDGSLNVQLRMTDDGPKVFEINPRFSSTVRMRHLIGFQDFVWTIDARMKNVAPPPWNPPSGTRIRRLSRELVIPPTAELRQ